MSLLLDALKKAELAKQIAKADSPTSEQQSAAEPAVEESIPRAITTRAKLPDITQPLEILTDDLPSSEQKPGETPTPRPELALQEPEAFVPAQPVPLASEPAHAGRAQAEQLFQVKEMDYNPRRPFYLTLGALAVVAVGYGGYVWWQMRPHYSIPPSAAQAAPAAPETQIAAAVPTASTAVTVTPSPSPQGSPASPPQTAVAVIPPIQPARPSRPKSQPAGISTPASAAARADSPATGGAERPFEINAPILAVDPLVQQGYRAFQRNDLAAARDSYQKVLAREPNNRDALLGLAAIDVRSGQLEAAEARYLKLLELDPRDSPALAALLGLRGRLDPVAAESRLKTLIATQPDVAHLYFSLGNQYGQQSRWTEAQAAYFRAYSIDPENADYAFNLAISLDQLRQNKSALEYYQKAIALAAKRSASFDPAQARARVQELSKSPAP